MTEQTCTGLIAAEQGDNLTTEGKKMTYEKIGEIVRQTKTHTIDWTLEQLTTNLSVLEATKASIDAEISALKQAIALLSE